MMTDREWIRLVIIPAVVTATVAAVLEFVVGVVWGPLICPVVWGASYVAAKASIRRLHRLEAMSRMGRLQ